MSLTKDEFFDKIFVILESYHYPELVAEFEPDQVAQSLGKIIALHFHMGVSPTYCAIVIWSLTMNYQVIPSAANATKH